MPAQVKVVTLVMAKHSSGEEMGHIRDSSVAATKDTAQTPGIWVPSFS